MPSLKTAYKLNQTPKPPKNDDYIIITNHGIIRGILVFYFYCGHQFLQRGFIIDKTGSMKSRANILNTFKSFK